MATAVLLPVKAFRESKLRLAAAVEAHQRRELARSMASHVAATAHGLPVWVVCDDDDVVAWAESVSAETVWSPSKGLNAAVTDGVRVIAENGFDQVIVAHADLPLATDLRPVADFPGVTLVPDRREDGTNVIGLPTTAGFKFHYGPSSFRRHREEASRRGLEVRVLHDPTLSFDLDTPTDLDQLRHHHRTPPAFLATAALRSS
jgi:2-phospho-L-lactate guanylyltransferase